jgi:molybdate transport system substrate-binding protein
MRPSPLVAALGAWLAAVASPAEAGQTNVAVAANFTGPAKEIASVFKQRTRDAVIEKFGYGLD